MERRATKASGHRYELNINANKGIVKVNLYIPVSKYW